MGSLSPHRLSATTHRYGTFATRHRHGSLGNDLGIHFLISRGHPFCCCPLPAKANATSKPAQSVIDLCTGWASRRHPEVSGAGGGRGTTAPGERGGGGARGRSQTSGVRHRPRDIGQLRTIANTSRPRPGGGCRVCCGTLSSAEPQDLAWVDQVHVLDRGPVQREDGPVAPRDVLRGGDLGQCVALLHDVATGHRRTTVGADNLGSNRLRGGSLGDRPCEGLGGRLHGGGGPYGGH